MVPGLQPALEVDAGRVRGIGTGETAGDEVEPFGFRPYCFLKALASIHASALHRRP
jgi:hypothetical protein